MRKLLDVNVAAMLALGLALVVFFIDVATPQAYTVGVFHLLPLIVAMRTERPLFILLVAGLSSILVILDTLLSAPRAVTIDMDLLLGNKALTLGAIWIAALLAIARTQLENKRRRAAADAVSSNEALWALIEASPLAIVTLDGAGRVKLWNPAAEKIFGWQQSEVLGKPYPIVPPEMQDEFRWLQAQGLHGESFTGLEVVRIRRDGSLVPLSMSTALLRNAQGQVISILEILEDITQRKRLAEEVSQRQAQLAHVLRLNTMGKMVSELAHEINQPLHAISNYASACRQVLQGADQETDELAGWVERIAEQADRAAAIIHRLMQFVRKDEPGRETVSLNELIENVTPLVEFDARRHRCRIQSDLEQPSAKVTIDRIQIEQVLVNLIVNAIEAMEGLDGQGGEVTIRSRTCNKEVEVEVQDIGPGIKPEHAPQLFEPYFTTKPAGMGLGLSISRSSIEAHGGRLWAVPNAGRGMTFHFTLPRETGDAAHGA